MPYASAPDGTRLHYRFDGPADGPLLILSNSLGTTLDLWAPLMPRLRRFRVLRYDTRGHGLSEAPAGDYSMALLGQDVLALMAETGLGRAHFCGVSMGGGIGQWLALTAPERIERLVLANTGPVFGAADVWRQRIETVRTQGMEPIAAHVIQRWFTPQFRDSDPVEVARILAMLTACDPAGYAANCAAVRDADFRGRLGEIGVPTLVIAGAHDPATPPALAEELAANIPGARLVTLDAAHLSANEQPEAFAGALTGFLG